ncbi:hypothetical protein SH584_11485 [Sphingomonas sp. LY29]|uniref:hypothetical protein n=1 Tax=Sphingomonas sp. LY29 TaxID=3095341 RepID=UPI002D79B120|nr:hypothetical protein [Sphingomonas sp. LY29]WRP25654.1 hypothetical protein SH584_11485 [Sphingomonas sp. LY29]
MIRKIGQHWEGDVRVTWYGDDVTKEVTVERWQDPQRAVDMVAAVNAEGGGKTIDGLGKPVVEVPIVAAMDFAARRGIPWEKLLYSNDYDEEFKRFAAEHSKLTYQNAKSVHTVQ